MIATKNDKWLRVHYLNPEDKQEHSEILRSSEIAVTRGWLNTIQKIEILHEEQNLYQCLNESQSEILTGVDARNFAGRLTRENEPRK
jgi:hypothetical protein